MKAPAHSLKGKSSVIRLMITRKRARGVRSEKLNAALAD